MKTHQHCPDCGAVLSETGTTFSVVLDESGSMASIKDKTIDGFNKYVSGLKKEGVSGRLTLTKFNSRHINIIYDSLDINKVPKLNNDTYIPDDTTPLYDAIGKTIKQLDKSRSNKVIMIIITDGLENASHTYSQGQISDMIRDRQNRGWTFVYLGANQDSWSTGQSIGIYMHTISNYDTVHMDCAFKAATSMSANYASTGSIGKSAADHYTDTLSE